MKLLLMTNTLMFLQSSKQRHIWASTYIGLVRTAIDELIFVKVLCKGESNTQEVG